MHGIGVRELISTFKKAQARMKRIESSHKFLACEEEVTTTLQDLILATRRLAVTLCLRTGLETDLGYQQRRGGGTLVSVSAAPHRIYIHIMNRLL